MDSKTRKFRTGLGTVFLYFDGLKPCAITGNVITKSAKGEEVYLDRNDSGAVLEAKLEGYEYTPITYCYCGNVKRLSGLNCVECTNWSRFQR